MYIIKCATKEDDFPNGVKINVIENYLIFINSKLTEDQAKRIAGYMSIHKKISISCINLIQVEYILAVLKEADYQKRCEFNVIDFNSTPDGI